MGRYQVNVRLPSACLTFPLAGRRSAQPLQYLPVLTNDHRPLPATFLDMQPARLVLCRGFAPAADVLLHLPFLPNARRPPRLVYKLSTFRLVGLTSHIISLPIRHLLSYVCTIYHAIPLVLDDLLHCHMVGIHFCTAYYTHIPHLRTRAYLGASSSLTCITCAYLFLPCYLPCGCSPFLPFIPRLPPAFSFYKPYGL